MLIFQLNLHVTKKAFINYKAVKLLPNSRAATLQKQKTKHGYVYVSSEQKIFNEIIATY